MIEIFTLIIQKQVYLEHKTQYGFTTHASASNGIKIPIFWGEKVGDDVIHVQCPFDGSQLAKMKKEYS